MELAFDHGGITPIPVSDAGATPTFESGSVLDVSWIEGKEKFGTWDTLVATGGITNNGLTFKQTADADWSYQFVDNYNSDGIDDTLQITAVPEPSSLAVLLIGAACLFSGRRRRRK